MNASVVNGQLLRICVGLLDDWGHHPTKTWGGVQFQQHQIILYGTKKRGVPFIARRYDYDGNLLWPVFPTDHPWQVWPTRETSGPDT